MAGLAFLIFGFFSGALFCYWKLAELRDGFPHEDSRGKNDKPIEHRVV